jgi:hypothetical protein
MKQTSAFSTLAALANVNELASALLPAVVGDALADNLNGQPVRQATIHSLAMAEVQKTFNQILEPK